MTIVKQIPESVGDLTLNGVGLLILIFLMSIILLEPKLNLKLKQNLVIVTVQVLVTIIVNLIRANARGLILQLRGLLIHTFLVLIILRLPSTHTLPPLRLLITLLLSITLLRQGLTTLLQVIILREVTIVLPITPLTVEAITPRLLITRRAHTT